MMVVAVPMKKMEAWFLVLDVWGFGVVSPGWRLVMVMGSVGSGDGWRVAVLSSGTRLCGFRISGGWFFSRMALGGVGGLAIVLTLWLLLAVAALL